MPAGGGFCWRCGAGHKRSPPKLVSWGLEASLAPDQESFEGADGQHCALGIWAAVSSAVFEEQFDVDARRLVHIEADGATPVISGLHDCTQMRITFGQTGSLTHVDNPLTVPVDFSTRGPLVTTQTNKQTNKLTT